MEYLDEKIQRTQLEIDRLQNQINKLEQEKRAHEDHKMILERQRDNQFSLGS